MAAKQEANAAPPSTWTRWAAAGWLLAGAVALAPLALESRPIALVRPYAAAYAVGAKAVVVLGLMASVWVAVRLEAQRGRAAWRALVLLGVSGLMTCWHWEDIDSKRIAVPDPQARGGFRWFSVQEDWQRPLYLAVLNHQPGRLPFLSPIPHVWRPLPYGFTRALERATGDWRFACAFYRCFFSFWFLWGSFAFVRRFNGTARAWLVLAAIVVLYPLSIHYYGGQLTDPLSHALFIASLLYLVDDRGFLLALTLFLGILAKETAVILVPAYWACRRLQGKHALWRSVGLGVVCLAAYGLARIPFGWRPELSAINGARGLMIGTNLGIGKPLDRGLAPLYQNYLQPIVFIGVWLPAIFWNRRRTDRRLLLLVGVLTPLLLLSNLCFGWMYESRNYVPLLPLLAAAALGPPRQMEEMVRCEPPLSPA